LPVPFSGYVGGYATPCSAQRDALVADAAAEVDEQHLLGPGKLCHGPLPRVHVQPGWQPQELHLHVLVAVVVQFGQRRGPVEGVQLGVVARLVRRVIGVADVGVVVPLELFGKWGCLRRGCRALRRRRCGQWRFADAVWYVISQKTGQK